MDDTMNMFVMQFIFNKSNHSLPRHVIVFAYSFTQFSIHKYPANIYMIIT